MNTNITVECSHCGATAAITVVTTPPCGQKYRTVTTSPQGAAKAIPDDAPDYLKFNTSIF